MVDSLRGMLPPIYQPFFDAVFDKPKPQEKRATCNKCAMCDHGEPSPVPMEYFNKQTKCCTYFPQLPNYLVGAILADEAPDMEEGKRRIRETIKNRMGTTPYYLNRPRKMTLIMQGYGDGFGKAPSLLCPYFDKENPEYACTIWRHREAICMTYYCKYVDGQRGYDFWVALKNYIGLVQRRCAKFAAEAVDAKGVIEPTFAKNALTLEDIEDLPPSDRDYKAWWGSWVGREEEFYIKCYEWMKATKPNEFTLNIDQSDEGKQYLDDMKKKLDKLETKLIPARLVRNGRMREDHVGEKVVVTTYHRYDSFALDKDLYEVVGMFKAEESLDENLARLKVEGIELAPELIEFLFAAGVLVEPMSAKAPAPKNAEQGELAGRRASLAHVLNARGISIDELSATRLAMANSDALDRMIRKAATASTLHEVLDVQPGDAPAAKPETEAAVDAAKPDAKPDAAKPDAKPEPPDDKSSKTG